MKKFNLFTVLLGMLLVMPAGAMASADDFDGVTVEAIELEDSSSDSVTHEVEVPHEEEIDDHQEGHHDSGDKEDEHENEHEEDREDEQENEDSHDDHAESSSDESVS